MNKWSVYKVMDIVCICIYVCDIDIIMLWAYFLDKCHEER